MNPEFSKGLLLVQHVITQLLSKGYFFTVYSEEGLEVDLTDDVYTVMSMVGDLDISAVAVWIKDAQLGSGYFGSLHIIPENGEDAIFDLSAPSLESLSKFEPLIESCTPNSY